MFRARFGTVGNRLLTPQRSFEQLLVVSFYTYDIGRIPRSNPSVYDDLFKEADAITCLSEHMRDDLTDVECPPEKIHKDPLCIDVNRFQYTERTIDSKDPVQVLSVARFVEKMDYSTQLRLSRNWTLATRCDISSPMTATAGSC